MGTTMRAVRSATVAGVATMLLGGSLLAADPSVPPSGSPSSVGSPGASAASMPSSTVDGLTITGAWARTSPMIDRAGAAYLVITNSGTADDALVGGSTDAAAAVELHETTRTDDGMMAMMPVESVPIPAGGQGILEPGGYHMMLIDLATPLVEGTTFDVTLRFQSGASITVPFEVRAMVPMMSPAAGSPAPMGSPVPAPSPLGA